MQGAMAEQEQEQERERREAERLLELGRIEYAQSRHQEALNCYVRTLEIFREHCHLPGEGRVLGNLGMLY